MSEIDELQQLKQELEVYRKSAGANIRKSLYEKLEKIKEIAEKLILQTDEYENCYYKDECYKCNRECQYKMVDDILQIIEGD